MRTAVNNFLSILLLSGLLCPLSLFGQDSLNITSLSRTWEAWGYPQDMAVQGNLMYVATEETGLRILDITVREAPVEIGYLYFDGSAYGVDVAGDIVYVALWIDGICAVDVSDPTSPRKLGSIGVQAYDVVANGQYLYTRNFNSPFGYVIDVSDPENMQSSVFWTSNGTIKDLQVEDGILYCLTHTDFEIFDLTNPALPALFTTVNNGGVAFAISSDRVYITGMVPFTVLDITFPFSPAILHEYQSYWWNNVLTAAGDTLFLGTTDVTGIRSYDFSDLDSPILLDYISPVEANVKLELVGSTLYGAAWYLGLQIYDVSNPNNITFAGEHDPLSPFGDIALIGDNLWVGSHQVDHLDVTNARNPLVLEQVINTWSPFSINLSSDGALLMVVDSARVKIWNTNELAAPVNEGFNYHASENFGCELHGDFFIIQASFWQSASLWNWTTGQAIDLEVVILGTFDDNEATFWCGARNNHGNVFFLRAYDYTTSLHLISL